jgi:hypothetical protein
MLQSSRERILGQAALSGSLTTSRHAQLLLLSTISSKAFTVDSDGNRQVCSMSCSSAATGKPRPDSTSRRIRITRLVGDLNGLGNGFQPQQ